MGKSKSMEGFKTGRLHLICTADKQHGKHL